jgi:uncharacterized protein YydD (DUF2326 family)
MIHKIYANDKRFKPIQFKMGLNIIKADKKPESGKKDSRNGLGKTTLINIVHFCLGSELDEKLLPVEDLKEWIFFIEIDIFGKKIITSRSISNSKVVKIIEGDYKDFPIKAEKDEKEKYNFYKLEDWKSLLGMDLFGLEKDETKNKYAPSFRSLISYFIRRGNDAYSKSFYYFRSQSTWSVQVNNAFFLGLNWKYASEAQHIKDKSVTINSLNKAIKMGIVSSQGELEAERIRLEKEVLQEKNSLSNFKVHPQYQEIQKEANLITKNIHDLSNNNLMLNRKLERYEDSIKSEKTPEITAVEKLYEEFGIHFADRLKKTLDEAKNFHSTIIKNRKHFLETEISEIKNEIFFNEKEVGKLVDKRSKLMSILQSHGALDEFTSLQERFADKRGKLLTIKSKISDIKEMSELKNQIKTQKIELESRLRRDYEICRLDWENAINLFNENSQALYNRPGDLIINVSVESGYKFDVSIQKSNSEGVGKMKIFCYDLMLAEIFAKKGKINFLIHDSSIFDGVDSRQTALALQHAHKKGLKEKFQYICTFNSDRIPTEDFDKNFIIDSFIRLQLHDKDHEGSILGFSFNKEVK